MPWSSPFTVRLMPFFCIALFVYGMTANPQVSLFVYIERNITNMLIVLQVGDELLLCENFMGCINVTKHSIFIEKICALYYFYNV